MSFKGWVKPCGFIFLFTPKWVDGVTIFPFIFIRPELKNKVNEKSYNAFVNHERIHIVQQVECLVIPYYLMYGLNYLANLIRFKKHYESYYNICFEREAYQNQDNLEYLNERKRFIWKKYFK